MDRPALYRHLFGLAALIVVAALFAYPQFRDRQATDVQPELIRLTTGSTQRIADGRAQIWLGEIDARSDDDGMATAVAFEVVYDGQSFHGWAIEDRFSGAVGGCRVRLVRALDTVPPSAEIEVTWKDGFTPNLQAAGSATLPPRPGTSR